MEGAVALRRTGRGFSGRLDLESPTTFRTGSYIYDAETRQRQISGNSLHRVIMRGFDD